MWPIYSCWWDVGVFHSVWCQHVKLSFNICSLFLSLLLFLFSSIFIDDTKIALHLKDNGGKILALLPCKMCLWTIRHHSDLTFLINNSYFSCLCPNRVILVTCLVMCVYMWQQVQHFWLNIFSRQHCFVPVHFLSNSRFLYHAFFFSSSTLSAYHTQSLSCSLYTVYILSFPHSLFVFPSLNSQNSVSKIQVMCFWFGASSVFLYQSETAVRAWTFHQ